VLLQDCDEPADHTFCASEVLIRCVYCPVNRDHLQEDIRKTLTNPDSVHVVVASIDDEASMQALAAQTKVIVSTAGPFDIIGMPVRNTCFSFPLFDYVSIGGSNVPISCTVVLRMPHNVMLMCLSCCCVCGI
jgi:hypothetical protein